MKKVCPVLFILFVFCELFAGIPTVYHLEISVRSYKAHSGSQQPPLVTLLAMSATAEQAGKGDAEQTQGARARNGCWVRTRVRRV